ncbi:MAG: 3-phosphoshikimate 1-carboxyvinyltransferase [Clostridia bacterium]|nr:3-phosphoshikimate 1-carboxyvinyltransferase [Clostridia bacterium]
MTATFKPSSARGTVFAPPSKSMAHRLLISAGLSAKKSTVRGVAPSQDVLATLDCLKALGADFCYENDTVTISGINISSVPDGAVLNCRECGSTLRFFIPIALLCGKKITFIGSEKLFSRPLGVYEEICKKQGILFSLKKDSLTVCGTLKSGDYAIRGDISSQFVSGLLFALPLLKESSTLTLIPPVESRSYIDMTVSALSQFGVKIKEKAKNVFEIGGLQSYLPQDITVEGDYSNAAFLEALNTVGGDVRVLGLDENSLQGDKVFFDYFERLSSADEVLDISNCPDLGPVLFAVAAVKGGGSFCGTARLKIKESDRAEAMKTELSKLGVDVTVGENTVTVASFGLKPPKEALFGHNDHRIVMALSVLLSVTGGSIYGAEAINKSFPDFFDKLISLGIEVETDGMDN